MGISATYHWFCEMNCETGCKLLRADFAGINIALIGGSMNGYYYGFYCDPTL